MKYYSAIKNNEIMPFAATWMDLEIIILTEVKRRKTYTTWYHLYVESKIWHRWTYLWNRNRLIDIGSKPTISKGERGGGREVNEAFGISRYELPNVDKQQGPTIQRREL